MIHLPTASPSGTSYHGTTVKATPKEMVSILGEPDYLFGDKTNMEWIRELDSADVFTIYDWKYYNGIKEDEIIIWNIGGRNRIITENAKEEIMILLNKHRKNNIYA